MKQKELTIDMESDNRISTAPELVLFGRKQLHLRGIEDVVSFDEVAVYLITRDGELAVEGAELHIKALDVSSGEMEIEGHIRSMVYNEKSNTNKSGFFAKIFK